MQGFTKDGEPASSMFDQLRTVARYADREMAALRRGRRDPTAFVDHDPTETLLALRREIDDLRRGVETASAAESAASAALHDLAAATDDFTEQRRADLAAITAYVVQYGYEAPPQPPPEEAPAEEVAEQQAESAGGRAQPPAVKLDTPEEVQLSDMTLHMLRGRTPALTSGRPALMTGSGPATRERAAGGRRVARLPPSPAGHLPPAEDDTADAAVLLNFRPIPIPLQQRASPDPRGRPPPLPPADDAVLVTPGLWVKRRSTLLRPPPAKENRPPLTVTPEEWTPRTASPSPAPALSGRRRDMWSGWPAESLPTPVWQSRPAAAASAATDTNANDSLQSPELSEETRAMLARRKLRQV